MTVRKVSLKETMKRVAELKQETIEKAKKIPGSEVHVKKRMMEFKQFTKKKSHHKKLSS